MINLTYEEHMFLLESNKIERLYHEITKEEILAFSNFMKLEKIHRDDLKEYVWRIEPGAILRNRIGKDITIGGNSAPRGGHNIEISLETLLEAINEKRVDAFTAHREYELLHPFTDGNGRSGRMIWWWMMGGSPLGFLHAWYYQSLDFARRNQI